MSNKPQKQPIHKKERGNVLFIILLAVALFAALSYAVTQSTRSGGGDASRETTRLQSAQIVQYGGTLTNSIIRMKLSNNCTDDQISFENPIVSGYTNPNAPADYRCHIFRPEGGGVVFQSPPQQSVTGINYLYDGYAWFTGIGSSSQDIALFLPIVSRDLCEELSKKMGNSGISGILDFMYNVKFTGLFGVGSYGHFFGSQGGCVQSPSGGYPATIGATYWFYMIILPR